jgi:hypothetical protein
VIVNNDTNPATVGFSLSGTGLEDGTRLVDRLGAASEVTVKNGTLNTAIKARAASVFVKQ